jgi:hypothetical protein
VYSLFSRVDSELTLCQSAASLFCLSARIWQIFSGLFPGTVLQDLVFSGELLVALQHCFAGSSFFWHALGCFLVFMCCFPVNF